MKFTMEIDSERNPNAVGEYLRSDFFRQDAAGEFGCYTTFDWREDVENLDPLRVDPRIWEDAKDEIDILMWARGRKNSIECRWYWDGDGVLVFILPDGSVLVNDDCKKDNRWVLHSSWEEYSGESQEA